MSSQIRVALLESMHESLKQYTHDQESWRPGLVDLVIYNQLTDMLTDDMDSPEAPDYLWRNDVNHIMGYILDTNHFFDSALEFGSEQLFEELTEYLITNDFIIDPVDDEELQQLLDEEE